jgi:hypothetical protein
MQKVKALANTMHAVGSPLHDNEITDYMLTGLSAALNPIAASMDFATTPVLLTMFYKTGLNYEGLQKQQQPDPEDWTSSKRRFTSAASGLHQQLRAPERHLLS